jgi:hypothetical protein
VEVPTPLPPPSVAPNKHRTRVVIYTRGGVDATIEDWSVSKKSALERIAKCLEMDTVSNKYQLLGINFSPKDKIAQTLGWCFTICSQESFSGGSCRAVLKYGRVEPCE